MGLPRVERRLAAGAAAAALALGCSSSVDSTPGGSAGAGGGSSSSTSTGTSQGSGGGFACEVCDVAIFDCSIPGGATGTATITQKDASGCSGVIAFGAEMPELWIHCDTGEICVEHATECFPATATPTSFSYDIPSKYTISCTAQ